MNEDVMAPRDKTGTRGSTRRDTTVASAPPRPATKPSDPGMGTLTPSERLAARQSPKPEPYNPQPLGKVVKSKVSGALGRAFDKNYQTVADVAGLVSDTAGLAAGTLGAITPEPVTTGLGVPLATASRASMLSRYNRLLNRMPSRGAPGSVPTGVGSSAAKRMNMLGQTSKALQQKSGIGGKIVDMAGNPVVNFIVPHGRSKAGASTLRRLGNRA